MKKAVIFAAVLGLSVSLSAQSLVELAKREKERREALKGRAVVLVRSRDLRAVQKTPAVEVLNTGETETGEAPPAEPAAVTDTTIPEGAQIVPRVEGNGPALTVESDASRPGSSTKVLEAQMRAAAERVDLLATKMAALRQQFEAQDSMTPGYVIQQQIVETNASLAKAQAQLARIQEEIDRKKAGIKKRPETVDR
jgi:hypothetical protein